MDTSPTFRKNLLITSIVHVCVVVCISLLATHKGSARKATAQRATPLPEEDVTWVIPSPLVENEAEASQSKTRLPVLENRNRENDPPSDIVLPVAKPEPKPKPKPTPKPKIEKPAPRKVVKTRTVSRRAPKKTLPAKPSIAKVSPAKKNIGSTSGKASTPVKSQADFGSYNAMIQEAFHGQWQQPRNISSSTLLARTKITIAPDGRILSARIVDQSPMPEMNTSVERALQSVTRLRPLPRGMAKGNYTILIRFELKPTAYDL